MRSIISDTEVDACVDELKLADGPVLELEVFIFLAGMLPEVVVFFLLDMHRVSLV